MMTYSSFLFLIFIAPFVLSSGDFQRWKLRFRRQYNSSDEERYRYEIWKTNLNIVDRHNKASDSSFQLGMNRFADQVRVGNRERILHDRAVLSFAWETPFVEDVPDSFDWRTKGAVSPVKNQGRIGSASAFATLDSIESMHFIKTGKLVELSINELTQCCNSSLLNEEFACVQKLGGLCDAASYPSSFASCQSSKCTPVAKVVDVKKTKRGDEEALKVAVYRQPVLAAIDASHSSFQLYRNGVYYEKSCSSQRLDHAVLVVGYGSQGGNDFWIVKNSWGVEWGMKGYILMSRNRNNNCGIATSAMCPVGT
ncbi:procathepsin L-like [Ostrea edulis]|uniref:procathepsin L-like n=1 Tax=Ostrea edulis TaxID=37623 RepID=UPI0024AECF3C|nr:procathepsin L-like [Ostrea edulis]